MQKSEVLDIDSDATYNCSVVCLLFYVPTSNSSWQLMGHKYILSFFGFGPTNHPGEAEQNRYASSAITFFLCCLHCNAAATLRTYLTHQSLRDTGDQRTDATKKEINALELINNESKKQSEKVKNVENRAQLQVEIHGKPSDVFDNVMSILNFLAAISFIFLLCQRRQGEFYPRHKRVEMLIALSYLFIWHFIWSLNHDPHNPRQKLTKGGR